MTKLRWLAVVLFAAAGSLVLVPGDAEAQKGKKKKEEVTKEQMDAQIAQDIVDLVFAGRLVEMGRKLKAPDFLLTAACLYRKLSKVKMAEGDLKPEIEVDRDAPAGTKVVDQVEKAQDLEALAKALFDEAEVMGEKLGIKDLVKQASDRPMTRAPIGGPKQINRQIGGNQTHVFRVQVQPLRPLHFGFRASLPLRVSVVRSDNSNPYGAGIVNHATTTFHPGPSKTGVVTLTIRVHNVAAPPATYSILMN